MDRSRAALCLFMVAFLAINPMGTLVNSAGLFNRAVDTDSSHHVGEFVNAVFRL